MLSHRIHPELPTTFFFFPPFSQLRSKDIDRVWVFSNTRNPLPSLCSRNECKVFVCGSWVRKTAMRENTTLKCMSEGWTRIIGRRKVFSNTSKRKLNGKCKGRKFLSVSEVNKVSLDQNMKWFLLIYNWDFQEYWNSGWFRNTTFDIKLIHTHTHLHWYVQYNIEHKIPLAMLMTYKLQLAFSQFFSHAFLSSFSSFLYVSLQYWTVEIGVETRRILKNENTEGEREQWEREDIYWLCLVSPSNKLYLSWNLPKSGMELVGSSLLMILTVFVGVGGGPIWCSIIDSLDDTRYPSSLYNWRASFITRNCCIGCTMWWGSGDDVEEMFDFL